MTAEPGRPTAAPRSRRRCAVRLLLGLVALFWLVPGIAILVTSLRPATTYGESGWWTALADPSRLTLENYSSFINDGDLIGTVWNSLLIAVPSTVLPVGLAAMSGYAFAWGSFKGRNTVFLVIVALLVVPLQLALLPALEVFGLLDVSGLPAVWLFHTAFGLPFAVFLMRNYFATLPPDILDAARVDGAGQARVFLSIALPLSKPALASLAVLQFIWTWNDLLVALIFSGQSRPFTVAIQQRLDEFGSGIGVITPGVVIGALVPVAVFLSLRRYFEAGIVGGAMR